jgi:hypothetical protein
LQPLTTNVSDCASGRFPFLQLGFHFHIIWIQKGGDSSVVWDQFVQQAQLLGDQIATAHIAYASHIADRAG